MKSDKKDFYRAIASLKSNYNQLLLDAVKEGLEAIKVAKETGGYIGIYHDYPSLSFSKNGLPNLSSTLGSGPTDYRGCFSSYGSSPLIDENSLNSFKKLIDYARSDYSLIKRFSVEINPDATLDMEFEFDKINIISGIKDCLERYIHNFDSFEFNEANAVTAIAPTLSYIFEESLSIDICVPILFLSFPFDEYQLADRVYIERISDKEHLSRYKVNSYNTSTHKNVIYSATHALILKGWNVPNSERMWDFNILFKAAAYPIDIIDQFFGALRICTSVDTGYSQIYSLAKDWGGHCTTDLPYLQGVTVRTYPGWFEDYYWNIENVPVISEEDTNQIKIIFNSIISAKENSVTLALKRLNRCLVRDNEEDAVLDATIALESLLSDDGNQEMTHKLAMRVGALSKLDKPQRRKPIEAFRDVKKIYAYRSAIVHGSRNLEKKRIVKLDETKTTTAHSLAIDYVKIILKTLLIHEKYRDPRFIDEDLILGLDEGA